ncbi:STAS domain-containing protein [Candidatus Uabimicrobium sp. HlEnr_7]|uniref:STAS domain-containing protein n=1 Tax=Candidatus Uabimicrobium helgolandensis TaxID=3095367 RepID=UPI00355660C4
MDFSGTFFTASYQSHIFIKVEGWAIQNNSLFFKDFVDKMVATGFKDFIVDLENCRGMDSTFMGTLLYIINQVKVSSNSPITLVNTKEVHRELLQNLGIIHILDIRMQNIALPNNKMQKISLDTSFCAKRHIELVKKAHECLVELNDKNKEEFRDFLEILNQELE